MDYQQPIPNHVHNQIGLPNAQAVLVLGILSIVGCFMYALPGLVCGIISIVLSSKDLKLYTQNPAKYTSNSLSNIRAGRTCGIIGVSLSGAFLLFFIIYFSIISMTVLKIFSHVKPN